MSKYLGNDNMFEGLDTFEVESALDFVTITSEELIARCPITGHPDIYKIEITYTPGTVVLETKSLKMYLETWNQIGIYAEHLVVEILQDLAKALKPRWLVVTLTQNIRGGIVTEVEASYPNNREEVK